MGGEPAFELLLLLDQHLVVIVFVLRSKNALFRLLCKVEDFDAKDQDLSLLCINKFHMYLIQPCQNKWTNRVNFVFKQRASAEIIR